MPTLSVIDLAMFLLETPQRPFNVGPLVLLRPPRGNARRFADRLTRRMLAQEAGPPFNYRLKWLPVPSVEPMPDPDLSAHVHRLSLSGDGSMDDLLSTVCALHEPTLPRDGLLWQFYVIDGLKDGRVALYGKVHHGIIDGRSFVRAVTQWFSTDPADTEVRAMWQALPQVGAPRHRLDAGTRRGAAALLGHATGLTRTAGGLVGSALAFYRMLARQGLRRAGVGEQALDLPFVSVPDVLSGPASTRRNYAFATLPLAELKALGKAVDTTVNDMLLATLDAGLDRFLADAPMRPAKPLVADMPVALSGAGGGNQIAVLQLALGRPGSSARERLDAIRQETARVKAVVGANPAEATMIYTTVVHALPTLFERFGLRRPLRLANLVFSNPFGLPGRHYLMGAEVELALPMSVVAAGQMLNVTAVTLGDSLQLGFLGVPGAVDDIERLAVATCEAFEQLKAELREPAPRAPRRPATRAIAGKRIARPARPT